MNANGTVGGGRETTASAAAGTSDASVATAEEEAKKRNTDCFYFLACPLTCKKGNDCEYRHSEGARMNPRNCWYWQNASCLNPKCSFRHLPLDGISGSQGETSSLAQPSQKIAPAMRDSGAHKFDRQTVPCYYFQKGGCFKGDRCSFMHGPPPSGTSQSVTYSLPPQAAKVQTEQRHPQRKDSSILKECDIQCPKLGVEISTDAPLQVTKSTTPAKSTIPAEPSISNFVQPKKSILPFAVDVAIPKAQVSQVLSTSNDTSIALQNLQLSIVDEQQNGIESDEFLPESSPGFDVLVDDDSEDQEFFHNEDEYGGGRNLNSMNDFDHHHSDYESAPQFEGDRSNISDEYDHDEQVHSRRGWRQHRRSSERVLDRNLHDREREEAVNHINGSDLRLQLMKQRRLNGSRSVTSPEHYREADRRDDRSLEDRHGRGSEREWQQHQERSISSRLRGRLTLPKRSSPDPPVDYQYETERDRLRHRGRLSPALPTNNYQKKYQDRLRQRLNDEQAFGPRSSIHLAIKKDDADSVLDFAGPKSLAELKAEKNVETYRVQVVKEHSNTKLERVIDHYELEAPLSFEGPKPLSVILKRKRETSSGNSAYSGSGDEEHNKDIDSGVPVANSNVHPTCASEAHQHPAGHLEEEEEGLICLNDEKLPDYGGSTSKDEQLVQGGMIVDDMDDNDAENNEHKDEFDRSGVYFKAEDECMHQDDEDMEDDDDFARKIGLILS